MRIRSIKPEFFKHDDLASLDPLCRILFVGLWCMADSEGRLEDKVKRIKAEVLPYDECNVDAMLGDLQRFGFVRRYNVDGWHVIQILNFTRHQRLSGKEASTPSVFPEEVTEATVKQSGSNGEAPRIPVMEGKGREGKEQKILHQHFPETLRDPDFVTLFGEWEEHCRVKGKTLSPQTRRGQLVECERAGPGISLAALRRSINGNATWILWDSAAAKSPAKTLPPPVVELNVDRQIRELKEAGKL
jgi:hypothetical protein